MLRHPGLPPESLHTDNTWADESSSRKGTTRIDNPHRSVRRAVADPVETGRGVYEENSDIVAGSGDVLYFALVKSVAAGVRMDDIEKVLDRREGAVTRRPRTVKEEN